MNIGPIEHVESQTVECWCRHCVWWKERAIFGERQRLTTELVKALDAYRESIGPDQHYTSQQAAMVDAIAYATVFIVKWRGEA